MTKVSINMCNQFLNDMSPWGTTKFYRSGFLAMYSLISKISNEWSYLLQEVAILQIFWWFVNLKEHFLQKVCAPSEARAHTLWITGLSALLHIG